MNDITVTVVGNVAGETEHRTVRGAPVTSFRLGSTRRYFDRAQRGWVDAPTTWLTVYCWRDLGENVASSVGRGDPLIVTGRLSVRQWEKDGRRGKEVELEAFSVGHDLSRGTSAFQRRQRSKPPTESAGAFDDYAVSLAAAADEGEPGDQPSDGVAA